RRYASRAITTRAIMARARADANRGAAMARAITPVVVKNVTIGAGIPKIIAPITGDDADQLQAQVAALADHHVDIVEWRVDRLHSVSDRAAVLSIAHTLRRQLAGRPLLFTCRTQAEGG